MDHIIINQTDNSIRLIGLMLAPLGTRKQTILSGETLNLTDLGNPSGVVFSNLALFQSVFAAGLQFVVEGVPLSQIESIAYINTYSFQLATSMTSVTVNQDLAIPSGLIPNTTSINKWGRNKEIDKTTTPEDITSIGGIYAPPTTERAHTVVSTSAQDQGTLVSSGTVTAFLGNFSIEDTEAQFVTDGVSVGDAVLNDTKLDHSRVLTVVSETELTILGWHHYEPSDDILGNTYRIVSAPNTGVGVAHVTQGYALEGDPLGEFVIMNGLTPVNLAHDYYRLLSAHTHQAGSNNTNVGDITFTAAVDLTETAKILAGDGRTEMAFIHIPKGSVAYITKYDATLHRSGVASDAMAQIELRSQLWGDDGSFVDHSGGCSVHSKLEEEYRPYRKVFGNTDVWVRCTGVSDDNCIISASIDYILEKQIET